MAQPLSTALPELQLAEDRLRRLARERFGITYVIRWERPHMAAVRTEADTALALRWRDQAVTAARAAAERRAVESSKTPAQVKAAGDAAARAAYYRVAPFNSGFHGIGGAFDIFISAADGAVAAGSSVPVNAARKAAEDRRRVQGGSPVQIRVAGDVGAVAKAYELVGGLAREVGLRWGGTFSAPRDVYHFELNLPRSVVAAMWAKRRSGLVRAGTTKGGAVALLLAIGLGAALVFYQGTGWRYA